MKRLVLLLTLTVLLAVFMPAQATPTKLYRGDWFDVRYPASFKAREGALHPSSKDHPSAFFTAPDGSAQFYAFYTPHETHLSPRRFLPRDYGTQVSSEYAVSCLHLQRGDTRIFVAPIRDFETGRMSYLRDFRPRCTGIFAILRANNGSFTREVLTIFPHNGEPYVFGFKYANPRAEKKYRPVFEAFKHSLARYLAS